jgi:hypothetical protein
LSFACLHGAGNELASKCDPPGGEQSLPLDKAQGAFWLLVVGFVIAGMYDV